METFKNFLVGLFVAVLALVLVVLGTILWPLVIGLGSFMLFIAVSVLAVILVFYIIVLIGHIVRKGLKTKSR